MKYIGRGIRTKDEVMNGLEKAIHHFENYGFSLGNVIEKSSNTFIGRAGLIYLGYDDQQPDIEVGYTLTKTAWSKGYATELSNALIHWGFEHLTVERLVGVINPSNEKSRRVLEKIGMNYVGRAHHWNNEVALYELHKPTIDYHKIMLIPASLEQYPVLQNMARFYVYDISEYLGHEQGWEIPADGLYECLDFRKYWDDEHAFPFLISYENELAGFAIVDKKGSEPKVDFNMAQFFIARKFKHKGIGRYVAQLCFKQFPGDWEVMVLPGNEGAYRFWHTSIQQFSNNNFREYSIEVSHLQYGKKNIFRFKS